MNEPVLQHYFSATPAGNFTSRTITVELAGEPRTLTTAGGTFSPEHLDQGTAILLREIPCAGGNLPILDLGCGWGAIALSAALEAPDAEIWALDVNERALELTRKNADALGLRNLRAVTAEHIPSDLRFSEIRSNPPIRVGKEALHELLRAWLPRLMPGGVAYLVVAKHLGADSLQRWVTSEFSALEVDRVARDKGFHIIRAQA
jgi:16S rRNA (guanine1207-N2)-methyltransferase